MPRESDAPAGETLGQLFAGALPDAPAVACGDDGSVRSYAQLGDAAKRMAREIILRGGENISPYEFENALLAHPAVGDAVCFGIEDDGYGEVLGAAVALEADADPSELVEHCRERVASFKIPTVMHVLDAIPRTPTGKVQRRHVAASLASCG